MQVIRISVLIILAIILIACTTLHKTSPAQQSLQLQRGERSYESGYYKRAMKELLPLACDGNPAAQYAVGYMYYYGYGVSQDTDVGYFWIKRAADQHYAPAIQALILIEQQKAE